MKLVSSISSIFKIYKQLGLRYFLAYVKNRLINKFYQSVEKKEIFPRAIDSLDYSTWVKLNFTRKSDLLVYRNVLKTFTYQPLISIIVPVYNPPIQYLREAIDSVLKQVYSNWELCLADDLSTDPLVKQTLAEYAGLDPRIKVFYREKNGHISEASNSSISIARGEFIALLDQDDLLTEDALFHNVLALNIDSGIDMLYSDEDKINEREERFSPFFKPDWSPESFLSRNYICHFAVFRKRIVDEVGGFRKGFEGSQDYDLILRFTEKTDKVHHITKILYHWRTHKNSTALNASAKSYATVAGEKALNDALVRRGASARVDALLDLPGNFNVRYSVLGNPKVSIIIPSKNQSRYVSKCLDSIFKLSSYTNFEVIFVDNGSDEVETLELLEQWKKKETQRFHWIQKDIAFNFSTLINFGRENANGDYLILLNNDTEIVTPDWIEAMLGQAQRNEIGAVGAKLTYADKTIQHAGVLLGVGGIANHAMLGEYYESNKHYCYLKVTNNVSAVTGACFMVEANKFDSVQGFDENLAIAFNDIDFCLKLREKGLRNLFLPYVHLYHYESKSRGNDISEGKRKRLETESRIMMERWRFLIDNDPYYNPNLSKNRMDFSFNI
jgi:glycosyltransferase involved in cell wall biosynthesis